MTDLEAALRELDVDWPDTPDFVPAVRARVEAPAKPSWRRRLVIALSVMVVAAGGTLAVSPAARSAVLEWLGL